MPQGMRYIIQQWLEARGKLHTGGVDGADAYYAADTRLWRHLLPTGLWTTQECLAWPIKSSGRRS
jgi:hypothetical protein